MKQDFVYLSKRNVLTLLSKLNRLAKGEFTACTLIKRDDQHPLYPQTKSQIYVTAIENDKKDYVEQSLLEGFHVYLTRDTLTDLFYQLTKPPVIPRVYAVTINNTVVSIVDDDLYYGYRSPGVVLAVDEPKKG